MAYSMKELLQKYTTGSLPPIALQGSYPDTEPDLDDPVLLSQERDLTDIAVISQRVNELQKILDEHETAMAQKQTTKEPDKAVSDPSA